MELKATPGRMVVDGEVVEYGAFRDPFGRVDLADARIRVAGRRMPLSYSRFRLKEWQHFGIIADEFYFMFAVVDAKFLSNSFCYFLDRKTGTRVEHERLARPGTAVVPRDLWHSECAFRTSGYRVTIENRLAEGCHRARVRIEASPSGPEVQADLEVSEDLSKTQPLELLSILRGERPAYTHKVACPVTARLRVGDQSYQAGPDRGIAILDVSKAFFPYRSFWNWATCAGRDEEGRLVALNLGEGINLRAEEFNDNCLWVDGEISFLGLPRFDFNERRLLDPWHVQTAGRSCTLDFEPLGERYGRVNALVVMSDFHQPYGTFRGTATDAPGRVHGIDDYFGVVEHHVARY